MNLTKEVKANIDGMTYKQLLCRWRFAAVGDKLLQDESGVYMGERMKELRAQPGGEAEHVRISKELGW